MRGAHALEATRRAASRFAWNSDGVFGTGTPIDITSLWSRSCSDVPRAPAQSSWSPRIAGRVACAEPTTVPHQPFRFLAGAYGVRNHGAVIGAPVPPRVVSAFAALEMRRMLIACGCRDYSVRSPITESIPTTVCGGESKRVSGKSPAESRSRSQNHHRRT